MFYASLLFSALLYMAAESTATPKHIQPAALLGFVNIFWCLGYG